MTERDYYYEDNRTDTQKLIDAEFYKQKHVEIEVGSIYSVFQCSKCKTIHKNKGDTVNCCRIEKIPKNTYW